MAQQALSLPPGFADLSKDEQLGYVERLLGVVDGDSAELVLDAGQERLLLDRRELHRANPEEALPWAAVKAELAGEFG